VEIMPNLHKTSARQRLCSTLTILTEYLSIHTKSALLMVFIGNLNCSFTTNY
jgi:hypothetical protein